MKIYKLLAFSLIIVFMIFMVGCNTDTNELDPLENKNDKVDLLDQIDENINNDEKETVIPDESKEPVVPKEPKEPVIPVEVTKLFNSSDLKEVSYTYGNTGMYTYYQEGIVWIDNYQDYLLFNNNVASRYNEEFFETKGLILVGKAESSGSNKLELNMVDLDDDNNLVVSISRYLPELCTWDMRYHQFIIDYTKPDVEVKDVKVVYNNIKIRTIFLSLKDETSILDAKKFVEENKESIVKSNITFMFRDKQSYNFPTQDELIAYLKNFNNYNVEKYGLNRIDGTILLENYAAGGQIKLDSVNDLDFDTILEIVKTDDFINLSLRLTYNVTSN